MADRYELGRWYYSRGHRPRGPAREIDPGEPAAYSGTRTLTTFGLTLTDHTHKNEENNHGDHEDR